MALNRAMVLLFILGAFGCSESVSPASAGRVACSVTRRMCELREVACSGYETGDDGSAETSGGDDVR